MRILFMGTPDIAAECLKALYAAGHDICAVYTRRIRRRVAVQPLCKLRWNWGQSLSTAAKREMNSGVSISGSRLPRRMRSMPGTCAHFSTSSTRFVPVSSP